MASGNLSWLNLLTIVLALPMIDGKYFMRCTSVGGAGADHKSLVYSSGGAGGGAESAARPEYAVAAAGDEYELQPVSSGGDIRRVRRNHPSAL